MTKFSYKNKSILIVDDQRAFHVMLKTMLTNQGAKNITFSDNAENAVKLALRKTFDIYLIDYNLGSGKNGSQLIAYLRNNKLMPEQALCFIITGDNSKDMVLTAIEKSPDDYLMKPFSQTQLFNRLSKAEQKKMFFADIFTALEKKHYAQAIALCKEKMQIEPKYTSLCKNLLADIYIENEEYQAAEEVLKPMIEQRLLIRAGIILGKTYYLQKKYEQAITLLKRIVDRSPLQMEAHQWLARAYRESGNLNEALNILSHAANTTHHSIGRYQEVALLANEMHEHQVIMSSYASILQISRRSFDPDPCHLANYIRSIINYAGSEDDLDQRKTILKRVNSALYQSRFEEGRNADFDFNRFDEICQAKVLFTLNEQLKAKRKILKTLNSDDKAVCELDNTLLCESTFSLLDIGEFDYVAPYLGELKERNIIDITMQRAIKKYTGKALESRITSFKSHNRQGIQAFTQRAYENALEHFNQALEMAPLNSGALLNRLQVYVQLLKLSKKNNLRGLVIKCQSSFDLLSNTDLPEEHRKRYRELKIEFTALINQR